MCEARHQKWLEEHAKVREKHLYPVYYAAVQKEQAAEKKRKEQFELERAKALTRDAKSAASDSALPKMGAGLKKLQRASVQMQVGRMIQTFSVEAKKKRLAAKDPHP